MKYGIKNFSRWLSLLCRKKYNDTVLILSSGIWLVQFVMWCSDHEKKYLLISIFTARFVKRFIQFQEFNNFLIFFFYSFIL